MISKNLVAIKNDKAMATLPEQSKGTVMRIIYGSIKEEEMLIQLEKECSIDFCINSPSLSSQIIAFGKASVSRALDLLIVRLAMMLNVKHSITDSQIKIVVNDLIELYPHESLEDWILVFKRMRQGYYGESYHLLNLATIVNCMKKHLEEKYQAIEIRIKKEKEEEVKKSEAVEIDIIKKKYEEWKKKGWQEYEEIKKQPTKDEAYNEFKNDLLLKRHKDDKIKSNTGKPKRRRTNKTNPGNEPIR